MSSFAIYNSLCKVVIPMRSWNPLSRSFWQRNNFFTESHKSGESKKLRKENLLVEAKKALENIHPGNDPDEIPNCFKDIITLDLINYPVLTMIEGHLFDKISLLAWLDQSPINPLTNTPLASHQLEDFPEFNDLLVEFSNLRASALSLRIKLLHKMERCVKNAATESDCLIDPMSGERIQDPVITRTGDIFNKDSLESHLKTEATNPIYGTPLKIEDVKPFPEYKKLLDKFYEKQTLMTLQR